MVGFDLIGYIIFAITTSITPGPNNVLLFAYGKKFGSKHSGNLMLGISLGFSTMLLICGYGLGSIILANKTITLMLKIIGSVWLLYLAFQMTKIRIHQSNIIIKRNGFAQGYFMQFANPKAWIMAVSSASTFLPHLSNIHISVMLYVIIFAIAGFPCMVIWVKFGDIISQFINSAKANRRLGYALFALMIVSIVIMWM